jgi:hypothetical protein
MRRRTAGTRGVALIEYLVTLPLLILLVVGLVDCAQLVLLHSQVDHLTREGGNLASRGTKVADTWNVILQQQAPLAFQTDGQMIFTVVGRRDDGDPTPWVRNQAIYGGQTYITSRVGSPGGAASIPGINSLAPGVLMTVVESAYRFDPLFDPPPFTGITFPPFISEIAYF